MSQARRVLHNRYELLEKVGDGGMAVVYKARDIMLNRMVAVKILRDQYASDPNFLARFEREAQAAANLSHPNIVNVYDTGNEDGTHYIVMEFIDGQSLKEMIVQQAPFEISKAIDITAQIASAIDYAHRQGLIHRDIKPQNILMTRDGRAKVTDFGIAKGLSDATLTQTGVALGTVHYFSPEQARGEPARGESDLYSIAVVLYEMLTGRLPFEADTPVALALKHIEEPPPPPRRYNPAIPPMVEAIIMKALSKRVEQRYPTVGAFASALKAADGQSGPQAGVSDDAATQIGQPLQPRVGLPPNPAFYPQPVPTADPTVINTGGVRPSPYDNSYGFQQNGYQPQRQNSYAPSNPAYNEGTGGRPIYNNYSGYSGGYNVPIEPQPYPDEPPRRGGMGWGSFILLFLLFAVLAGIIVFGVVYVLPGLSTASPTAVPVATSTAGPPTPTNTAAPKQVAVPNLANLTQDQAIASLKSSNLQPGTIDQGFSDAVPSGNVMAQNPPAGQKANEGSKVNFTISQGVQTITLPGSYVNTDAVAAIKQLTDLGFKVTQKQESSASIQAGAVTRTDPDIQAGTKLPKGSAITIYVSSGPPPTTAPPAQLIPVPQVRSIPQDQATQKLTALGLKVKVIQVTRSQVKNDLAYFDSQPVGYVVGQDPDEKATVPKGSEITIAVKAAG